MRFENDARTDDHPNGVYERERDFGWQISHETEYVRSFLVFCR